MHILKYNFLSNKGHKNTNYSCVVARKLIELMAELKPISIAKKFNYHICNVDIRSESTEEKSWIEFISFIALNQSQNNTVQEPHQTSQRVYLYPSENLVGNKFYPVQRFYETYYDTALFTLIRNKNWVRKIEDINSGVERWCYQKTRSCDNGIDIVGIRGTEDLIFKKVEENIGVNTQQKLWKERFGPIAKYLTYRYHNIEKQNAYLDHIFFDNSGLEEYFVFACDISDGIHLSEALIDTPTQIDEYLRRFNPSIFKLINKDENTPDYETVTNIYDHLKMTLVKNEKETLESDLKLLWKVDRKRLNNIGLIFDDSSDE